MRFGLKAGRDDKITSETLVQITSTGVSHTDPIPPGGGGLARTGPVKKAEGGALTIGCFVDRESKEYIFVVNRSFHEKCPWRLARAGCSC